MSIFFCWLSPLFFLSVSLCHFLNVSLSLVLFCHFSQWLLVLMLPALLLPPLRICVFRWMLSSYYYYYHGFCNCSVERRYRCCKCVSVFFSILCFRILFFFEKKQQPKQKSRKLFFFVLLFFIGFVLFSRMLVLDQAIKFYENNFVTLYSTCKV